MRKSCLIALCFWLWSADPAGAQRFFAGLTGGGFDVTTSSILGGGNRRGCVTGSVSAGMMVSPRVDLFTGIGYGNYFYNEYVGSQPDRTQRLEYVEVPLVARVSFRRMPFLRSRGSTGPQVPNDRSGLPLIRFYLEGGMMVGLLTGARQYGTDNDGDFYAYNLKPMLGLGILGGGGHRINLFGGLRFYSSLRNEYKKARSPYLAPRTFQLYAITGNLGLQVRLAD